MPSSMTGFGRAVSYTNTSKVTVEIKSVNSRFLELTTKTPRFLLYFEDTIRNIVNSKIKRGRVELFIQVDNNNVSENYAIDKEKIASYKQIFEDVVKDTGIINDMKFSDYLNLPDVMVKINEPNEKIELLIIEALNKAIDSLCSMRKTEGEKIVSDINQRVELLEKLILELEDYTNDLNSSVFLKLQKRLSEILEKQNIVVEESRIISESAIYVDKMNVTEEIVRFKSHMAQLKEFLNVKDNEIGKKLDFLIQEINREVNTIGSKSQKKEIVTLVVDIKAELEKIREQIQNIE